MSQKRTVDFEQPLTSLEENHRILGIETPGLLCGWDSFTHSGTTLNMRHNKTGMLKTSLIPTSQEGPYGIIATTQGVQILEDADVPVIVATNAGNAYDRIDLLIMQHQHVEAPGGQSATYSVVQGSNGGPVSPAIPNSKIQVLIGKFYIKASTSDHTNTDWIREPIRIGNVEPYVMDELGQTLSATDFDDRDFNNISKAGIYSLDTTVNRPIAGTNRWHLIVGNDGIGVIQQAISFITGKSYVRNSQNGGTTWNAWQNLNNVDIAGFDPDDITDAIGATSLAALNYSSNLYVTDSTSLETAVGALDAALGAANTAIGNNTTNISNNLIAIGNLAYTSNHIIVDGESATTSLGKLDAAIGDRTYVNEYVITDGDILSDSLDDIDTAIGSRLYTAENHILDNEVLSTSLNKIDIALETKQDKSSSFTAVALGSSWIKTTGGQLDEKKVDNMVSVRATFLRQSASITTVMGILAVGNRPAQNIFFPCIVKNTSNVVDTGYSLTIQNNGNISLVDNATGSLSHPPGTVGSHHVEFNLSFYLS